jgi:lipoprotein-anchoring transpeptidase ErfK/SrfK
MSDRFSRRDFLKVGSLSLAGLAFGRFTPNFIDFDDSDVVRVATKSVSVYIQPSDKAAITGTWYKDNLLHVYEEVVAEEPKSNPIWYRVWGGYIHRARLQRVKTILNLPLTSIPEGTRLLSEVTVPFTQPWRLTKTYGWQPLSFRLYYESTYWIEAIQDGPDGTPWYRIFDDLVGAPYYAPALHLREIPPESFTPITPETPWENKRIEVNLTAQTLTAYEYDSIVFQTNVSTGLLYGGGSGDKGLSTKTPNGKFQIQEKMPSKHMGNGDLFAGEGDYELPGVPWTSFFTDAGHAFHGTYWHENFGTPMSHGCVNMRTSEAKWLFRWARPVHDASNVTNDYDTRGYGTTVDIHY